MASCKKKARKKMNTITLFRNGSIGVRLRHIRSNIEKVNVSGTSMFDLNAYFLKGLREFYDERFATITFKWYRKKRGKKPGD